MEFSIFHRRLPMYDTNVALSFRTNWSPLLPSYKSGPKHHIYVLGNSSASPLGIVSGHKNFLDHGDWALRIQSRVDISSEKMVAEVRQKRNAAVRTDVNPLKPRPRMGKANLWTWLEDQIEGQLSHNKLFLRLSSFHGIHYTDIFCIVNGNCSCQPISRCICIPFSFLLRCGSDNHLPALLKYLVFDQIHKMRNPGTTPPIPFIFILVSL